ncbi:unnamed protein product [Linum trigynum]|uniref:Prephenate dehydratase domain-containing protein n=1 Tax=Linum trigynum TaxID=586398 RepID=A0AAV2DP83_9ROSI
MFPNEAFSVDSCLPKSLDSALAQCEMTLSNLNITRVNADDTAGAAQIVAASGQRDTGAVASARAAEIYGLDIVAKNNVQDDENNITRFLILARERQAISDKHCFHP